MKQSDKRDKVDQKHQTSADIHVKKDNGFGRHCNCSLALGCPEKNTVVTHTLGLSSRAYL